MDRVNALDAIVVRRRRAPRYPGRERPMTMEQRPVADTWERGDPYERYVGRWSRRLAPRFLAWLHVPAGRRWLDVGCGTGALSAAILDHCAPSALTSIEPSEGFLEAARRQLAGRADLHRATATQIPLPDLAALAVLPAPLLSFRPLHPPPPPPPT